MGSVWAVFLENWGRLVVGSVWVVLLKVWGKLVRYDWCLYLEVDADGRNRQSCCLCATAGLAVLQLHYLHDNTFIGRQHTKL